MSGLTKIPPLNPATAVRRANRLVSIAMPRGGRLPVMAKAIPAVWRAFTELRARRQHFLRSDERAVDVGQDKRDFRCGF